MRTTRLALAMVSAAVLLAGCAALPPPQPSSAAPPRSCTEHSVPVNLSANDPTVYRIVGWLCRGQRDHLRATTVQLLVSGLTYSHSYWDTTYHAAAGSYVEAANERGYATFNIDRIGVGKSEHPAADRLTLQAQAYTISQIVDRLRSGDIGGTPFVTVAGVGHSLGAGILQYEAGTVRNPTKVPDYLILTGYLTKANPDAVARIGAALYPAAADPALASTDLPDGYLTTRPGSRDVFVGPQDTDAAILTLDEQRKQTSTLAERATVSAARDAKITKAIHIPVLLMVGQYDLLACGTEKALSCTDGAAVIAREHSNFSAATCVSAHVVAGAGHAINLHHNANDAFDYGNDWLDNLVLDRTERHGTRYCL